MKTEIKILAEGDLTEFGELLTVFEETFEMKNFVPPGNAHLADLLKRDDFIAVVAKADGRIIAGMSVYILQQYYSVRPLAYIYDLAVLPPYQRKGTGRRLINFITAYCRKKGIEEVFVQADKVDGYALDFYRSTQPTGEEDVSHFYYSLNK